MDWLNLFLFTNFNHPKNHYLQKIVLAKNELRQKCVFKLKGYNIVNTTRGKSVRSSRNGGQLLGKLTPLPPPSPSPLLLEQSTDVLQRGHTHADPTRPPGVLVRAIGAASRTSLAVWMPWPSSPTPGHPPVPVTFLFHP